MIKLQAIYRQNETDTVSLSNSILTINNIDYDLDNLAEYEYAEGQEQPRVYKQGEDIHILLKVPKNRMFMFHSGNLLRFFDIDSNGIIYRSELEIAIAYINETDDKKLRENLGKIKNSFWTKKKAEGLSESEIKKAWIDKGLK